MASEDSVSTSVEDEVRVLLVEDNPTDAELVRLMLGQAAVGYALRRADRIAGVPGLLEAEWRPEVVLLDLGLPDAQGLEALDAMRELIDDIPIVVLTGVDDDETALEALHRGAQDYVSKNDLNPRLLQRVLRHAMERQRLIDELHAARDRLEQLSRSDPLTGLLNRRGLEQALQGHGALASRENSGLHLVAWDLDDFKGINDTLGHGTGDAILVEVARRAQAQMRNTDLLARIGGDEFMALLPGVREAEAVRAAERLCDRISGTPFEVEGRRVRVTASVGVAAVEARELTFERILERVDRQLYRSKRTGKNRVSSSFEECAGLVGRVVSDPTSERLKLHVGAINRVADGSLAAYEALLRTTLPGLEAPEEFFSTCQMAGLRTEADLRALERLVTAATDLPAGVPCHFNVFPATLVEVGPEPILRILGRLDRREIGIEISEQQIVGEPAGLREPLAELRDAGYRIGLDHVGAGRTSLESLLVLEPDLVKIDVQRTFRLSGQGRQRRELERLLNLLSVLDCVVVVGLPPTPEDVRIVSELAAGLGRPILASRPASPGA